MFRDQPPAGGTWWRRLWSRQSEGSARRDIALALYGQIVGRARRPVLYREWHVPDTHDGRFEALSLEAAIMMRRLREAGPEGQLLAQELFNVMFADMDDSVREQGVGDLSVGKYVKRMASSFLARAREIEAPVADGDREALAALCRRYFHAQAADAPSMLALADYLVATDRALADIADRELLRGRGELATLVDPRNTAS